MATFCILSCVISEDTQNWARSIADLDPDCTIINGDLGYFSTNTTANGYATLHGNTTDTLDTIRDKVYQMYASTHFDSLLNLSGDLFYMHSDHEAGHNDFDHSKARANSTVGPASFNMECADQEAVNDCWIRWATVFQEQIYGTHDFTKGDSSIKTPILNPDPPVGVQGQVPRWVLDTVLDVSGVAVPNGDYTSPADSEATFLATGAYGPYYSVAGYDFDGTRNDSSTHNRIYLLDCITH